jgi:hypothetical protein
MGPLLQSVVIESLTASKSEVCQRFAPKQPVEISPIFRRIVAIPLVGVIEAGQSEKGKTETTNRLVGVSVHSYNHENVKSIVLISTDTAITL